MRKCVQASRERVLIASRQMAVDPTETPTGRTQHVQNSLQANMELVRIGSRQLATSLKVPPDNERLARNCLQGKRDLWENASKQGSTCDELSPGRLEHMQINDIVFWVFTRCVQNGWRHPSKGRGHELPGGVAGFLQAWPGSSRHGRVPPGGAGLAGRVGHSMTAALM